MGEGGLEPPRPYEHWHLKPARLPFRHSPEWMLHASNLYTATHLQRDICLGINGSGIVLVMSAAEWESRELESASRERLLVEIGTLQQALAKADQSAGIDKLQQQIGDLKKENGELQQQAIKLQERAGKLQEGMMAAKDFAMGAAARAGEAQAQVSAQASQLSAAQARVVFLSRHINRMRNSTTWELGRIMMLPIRVIKKITGKTA